MFNTFAIWVLNNLEHQLQAQKSPSEEAAEEQSQFWNEQCLYLITALENAVVLIVNINYTY